jgi:hypothetical protein
MAAYGDFSDFGYTHLVVNHFENFVDSTSGAKTNHIENMWQKLKGPHKARYGTHRSTLHSHMVEFMCRARLKNHLAPL